MLPRYPGRYHPDVNVFRRLQQFLHETGSVTAAAHAGAGRPLSVRTTSQ